MGLVQEGARVVVFDIETTKKPHFQPWQATAKLCSVGMLTAEGKYRAWLFEHTSEKIRSHRTMLKEIKAEFDKADVIVAHNLKFDIKWLWKLGIDTSGKITYCTQVVDYLLNGHRKVGYNLNATAERYNLGSKLDEMQEWWNKGYDTPEIPVAIHLKYLQQDVYLTADLYNIQQPRIAEYGLTPIASVSLELLNILAGMEFRGFCFSKETALKYYQEYALKRDKVVQQLKDIVGFDFSLNSGEQLSVALYGGTLSKQEPVTRQVLLKSGKLVTRSRIEKIQYEEEGLGIKPLKGTDLQKQGYYQTDKETLPQLKLRNKRQKAAIELLLKFANLKKVMSTILSEKDDSKGLINLVQPTGRVHPSFNQTVARTGRLSSSNPNAQNMPRGSTSPIKECIYPEFGKIVNVDLAQIEFRVAAELSRDPVMLKEIREGLDTHADNAIRFFGAVPGNDDFSKLRTIAKVFTFRLLFGGSAYAFFMDPKMPDYTLKEWEGIVKAYYSKYVVLKEWQDKNISTVMKQGYLRNPSGRILGFTKVKQKDGSFGYNPNQIKNYPIQSAASDLMYIAMIEMLNETKAMGLKAVPILQVHDSLVFDCPPEEVDRLCEMSIRIFENLPTLAKKYYDWDIVVPLTGDCEVGDNYRVAKSYVRCAKCGEVWWHPTKEQEVEADTFWCDKCLAQKDKRIRKE